MQRLQYVTYEVKDAIAVITIDRQEVRNAMLPQSWQELGLCLYEAERDDQVRVVILTGAGEKAFIAGGDVGAIRDRTPMDQFYNPLSLRMIQKIEDLAKPVIAAINGVAVGGGFEAAMACDIRIASPNAKFILSELNLGILPGAGGTQRLVRLIGLGRAKEAIMAGKIYDAQEALSIGLVMEIAEQGHLLDAAVAVAETMMRKGPVAMSVVKRILNHALDTDLATGLLAEQLGFLTLLATEDKVEGTTAFLEKRPAEFKGR